MVLGMLHLGRRPISIGSQVSTKGVLMIAIRMIHVALFALAALMQSQVQAKAGSAYEINAGVNATLDRLFYQFPGTQALAARAAGILVFPTVIKAGFGVGGEYGEGAMRVGGR